MALRYPSHKISTMERYVAESAISVSGTGTTTIPLTDRTLVRLSIDGSGKMDFEAGSEDGQYRILIVDSITSTCTQKVENSATVQLIDRAWLPEDVGEMLGLIWNATNGKWYEKFRSINYDSTTGVYVKNTTGSTIARGKVVRIIGADGNNPLIGLASNATEPESENTIGVVHDDIAHNAFGHVITNGLVEKVDTSTLTAGDTLYLGTAGNFTANKTSVLAPNNIVKIGNVVRAAAAPTGSIQVWISNGWELEELHNVSISAPANNEVLTYESATQLWKNKPASGGGGSPSIGGTITGGTAGSVLFVDPAATIAQDNANLFYDNTNNRLGLGTSTPSQRLSVTGNISMNGNMLITGTNSQILAGIGTATNAAYSFTTGEENTGINSSAIDAVSIQNNGVESVRVNASGNVKIGTPATAPDTILHVEKGSAGAATSNANAVATFENSTSAFLQILSPSGDDCGVLFGTNAGTNPSERGGVVYNHPNNRLDLRCSGNVTEVEIASNPVVKLNGTIGTGAVTGDVHLNIVDYQKTYTSTVSTTNATVTNAFIIAVPTNSGLMIEADVVGRQTNGLNQTNAYKVFFRVKNNAGTLTGAATAGYTSEEVAAWAATIAASGTNAVVQVTGAAATNITWRCVVKVTQV